MAKYRSLTLFVLILISTFCAQAQVSGGVKLGLNVNGSTGYTLPYYVEKIQNRVDWHGGLYLNFPLIQDLSLQTELLYSRKGSTQIHNLGGRGTKVKTSYRYLSVPVMISFRPIEIISLQAGLEAAYELDGGEYVNRLEASYVIGATWHWRDRVNFYARYVRGMTRPGSELDSSGNEMFGKNTVFQLGVAYQLIK